jgi:thiamine kinase-like enzyme
MLPSEVLEFAYEWVPGAGVPALECLNEGMSHDSYRVVRDGESYLLRVGRGGQDRSQRTWEAHVLKAAQAAYLAPAMIHIDAQRGLLLYRWVEGHFWSDTEAKEAAHIARLAELVRAIQRLKVSELGPRMSPRDWIERYRAALQGSLRWVKLSLYDLADQQLDSLGPPAAFSICHSDLHRFNLLETGQASAAPTLLLLDWEYTHIADCYWDLAGWSANNDWEDEQRGWLLRDFLGRPPSRQEAVRLDRLIWLYDFVCLLWCELYLTRRPETGATRLVERAAQLERRLR